MSIVLIELHSFIFETTQNYIIIFLKVIGRKYVLKSVNFLPASIKFMNPKQKYPHIAELFVCTRKMLAVVFFFPINSLISSGTCSTPKLKKNFYFYYKIKQYNVCLHQHIYQGLLCMPHPLFLTEDYFLKKNH